MDVKARFWWVTILVQNPFWVKMVKYLIIHLEGKRYEGHFKASPPVSLCDGVWNLKMWWEDRLSSDSTVGVNQETKSYLHLHNFILPAIFQPSFYLQCSLQLCILLSKPPVSLLFGVMSLQGGLTWISHQSGLVGIQTWRIWQNLF